MFAQMNNLLQACKYQSLKTCYILNMLITYRNLLERVKAVTFVLNGFFLTVAFKIYLFELTYFIFGSTGSSLLCVGFFQVQQAGATLCCGVWASHCGGFSSCGACAVERGLSGCGLPAQLLFGMWDLPGPGIEPVSPALAGGFFLSTVPPRES